MNYGFRIAITGLLVVVVGITVLMLYYGARLWPENTPVARGAINGNVGTCIDCHGQPDRDVPDDAALDCARTGTDVAHPAYVGKCNDILAYFEVVRLKRSFVTRTSTTNPNSLLRGEQLARKYNCFQCHGELGQGGFANTGALKGYVPGYFGNDFALLTAGGSTQSVKTWISTGIDPGLFANPIEGAVARFFIERQAISMPNFGTLPESSIRILADYVIALHQFGEMDATAIRSYSQQTQALRVAVDRGGE